MDAQVVAAIIGPLVTALVAAAGVLARSLGVRRRSRAGRARDITVAGETVTFINSYLAAQQRLAPGGVLPEDISRRALNDLEAAYVGMLTVAATDHEDRDGLDWGRVLRRALLRDVRRPWSRVLRAVYYVFLVLGFLLSTVMAATPSVTQEAESNPVLTIVVLIMSAAFCLVPAALTYAGARALDRIELDKDDARSPAPGPQSPFASTAGNYWPPPSGPRVR